MIIFDQDFEESEQFIIAFMKNLFEGQEQPKIKLKINKQFAEKYQKKKERELLDKKQQILDQLEDESDSSIEDEHGDLINDRVTSKFIETLAKIRYKHPDIYASKQVFEEEDFEDGQADMKKQRSKKLTYAETQKELNPEREEDFEEYEPQAGITPEKEQLALKQAFKQAASARAKNEDLLKLKKKTKEEIEDENEGFKRFLSQYKKKDEKDILQRYWGDENQLDEKDRFLRKYILTKGWIDKDEQSEFQDSSEDEEKMDEFEEKYNFRFEEPGASQLITFERDMPDTLRAQEEKARKRQRLAKAEREKELKKQLQDELNQLKIAKKNELLDKIVKVQQVGGVSNAKLILDELANNEFQPDEFDKKMDQLYNEEYFEEEVEEDSQELEIEESQQAPEQEDIDNVIKVKPTVPVIMKKNLNQEELHALKSEDINIWWFCDKCKCAINPGKFRWDCQVCEDYTLCEDCNQSHQRSHQLKKAVVPQECKPPPQEEVQRLIKHFIYCRVCQIKMTEENDFYKGKKDYLCVDCWEKDVNQNKYELIEAKEVSLQDMIDKDPERLKEKLPTDLKKLVDEYYDLDFEDVIAGGIKTKFQYVPVQKESFGLTNDDLLYADDKLLNQYVSIKKLAPYRDQPIKIKQAKARKLLEQIRKNAKKNKKLILRGQDPREYQKKQKEEQQEFQLEVEDNAQNNTLKVDAKRLKGYGV